MPSPIDGDDESTIHVARRGRASQVQVPELINREWIWIEDGEFSNQATSIQIIGLNLKHMWFDTWDSWKDVSYEHRMKLFECFKEKTLGRELTTHEMWKQSHCRKGSRPLDKDLSSLLVSGDDSEGSVQGKSLNWVDNRAETWVNYNGYVVEKYGDDRSMHPKFDEDLWSRATGGIKKGKMYGLTNVSGSRVHGRQDAEIEKLHLVIKELVKEKMKIKKD
ncbi:uncharacterized protein LOC143586547 [Bidens hawaiensis]|uniref:uncharacterized protein LOC143586547 n=1 Tax=Bidens hawaiensis TaxID=980011 RepID=UPI00404AA6E8